MVEKIYDGLLLETAAVDIATVGSEYAPFPNGQPFPTHFTFAVEITSGSGTWVLEGRNGPDDDWQEIDTDTAAKSQVIARFPRYRFRWSAATDLVSRATLNCVLALVA